MTASWKVVYEGELEGRAITVRESGDGTYKVLTKQNVHDEGIAYQDGKNFVHVSPSSVGEQVESEVNSRDSLAEALKELHFSPKSVNAIVDGLSG
ncbi:hypothetical protein EC912_10591 [Luteibacter rhizovicinus]|uniref:Uncharacterized protein n=1 Tax=Luteibacter rhizovicinus TaxID=242606 RepID=A0A4R3YLW5_9GAMM|nr:hypothetical protein [Luteibacter rhizovicinus]TCV93231.1 hypothetical protein EC912_10591 [Luteibacter rhizovicinus]